MLKRHVSHTTCVTVSLLWDLGIFLFNSEILDTRCSLLPTYIQRNIINQDGLISLTTIRLSNGYLDILNESSLLDGTSVLHNSRVCHIAWTGDPYSYLRCLRIARANPKPTLGHHQPPASPGLVYQRVH